MNYVVRAKPEFNLTLDSGEWSKFQIEKRRHLDGIQYRFKFPNEYGASVMKHSISYGHEKNLWELVVLKLGDICYDTKITDDVIGNLTDQEVRSYLKEIYELPPVMFKY